MAVYDENMNYQDTRQMQQGTCVIPAVDHERMLYIHVYVKPSSAVAYDLYIGVLEDDELEENDNENECVSITPNFSDSLVLLDEDWFSLELTDADIYRSI